MYNAEHANSRQIFHRAKHRVKQSSPSALGFSGTDAAFDHAQNSARPTQAATPTNRDVEAQHKVAIQFAQAFQSGDASQIAKLLAVDVRFIADGGGKAAAARRALDGREDLLNMFVGLHRSAHATGLASQAEWEVLEVNSRPALVVRFDGEVDTVFVLDIQQGTVHNIQAIRNPDKLVYLKRQLLTQ